MYTLTPSTGRNVWKEVGTELGTEKGMLFIITRALYGPNISGAAWRENLAETLNSLEYKSSKADADVWMKWYYKLNGDPYYKILLCSVDYSLHIGFKPK